MKLLGLEKLFSKLLWLKSPDEGVYIMSKSATINVPPASGSGRMSGGGQGAEKPKEKAPRNKVKRGDIG